jgi:hypothetical protein
MKNQMRPKAGPGAHRAEERNASSRRPPGPFQKLRDALTVIRRVKRDGDVRRPPGSATRAFLPWALCPGGLTRDHRVLLRCS